MTERLLHLSNIKKTFNPGTLDEKQVLKGLNLTIHKGDFISVIGGNGAGKSTLLNVISGATKPDSGQIQMEGKDITRTGEVNRAKDIARVFQNPSLGTAPRMTIAENLAIAMKRGERRLFGRSLTSTNKAYFKKLLASLDLGLEDRLDDSLDLLSGGQRQSISLLMATIKKPKLLLLDEHTSALDPKAAGKVMALTDQAIKEDQITSLMITHNMRQAIDYGNRLIMLHQGQIILDMKGQAKDELTVDKVLDLFQNQTLDQEVTDSLFLSD
ncbi:Bicarbonate transport ATP-binding protein CmpC [Alloiococcus otitis]|uniref:ABC transporter domain-containing protein n=1 Tax=Alloiococcus otitis ATCC 51267 TaxID=883081 RepID=K9EBN2_9LACT|nr:ATP-binding cassette domain-containing protein [Alloiococcus otitis]EKU94083.1 hypothetical protein HMPREF9698_00395 [Alloiococcus otitis ATCC 51267]SUU81003.1 Bicarbonate transport ATP-binding protein CmpC [Alloiococcus otitis]